MIKNKQRGLKRIQNRLVEQGQVPAAQVLDHGLSAWEEQEWVAQLLKSLPAAQREVLACPTDGFTRQEPVSSPCTYNEARTIGEHFRDGTPVIMNLTEMVDSDARRLIDFAAGLIFGLHESIDRVTNRVFLLSPASIEVTPEDKARIAERGFFNQT